MTGVDSPATVSTVGWRITDRVLSLRETVGYARMAGFSGKPLVTIVAIAMAESGLHTEARHVNTDAEQSVDRGILQINSKWHPEVTDAQADDPAQAFVAGYTISTRGTNFAPWSTFNSNAYQQFVPAVQAVVNGGPMTVQKPPITWIGTAGNNLWHGRGQQKLAWVNHIAEGTLAAVDSWFSNPIAQASTNFCVGLDGTIHMYVDPEGPAAPYANGLINKPAATVQALLAQTGNANPNYWTISIEHEGHSGDVLTPAQLASSAQLAAYYIELLGIANDENHLLGHYEFDSVTRAGCPGWSRAQWIAWEDAVNAFLSAPPPPAPDTGPIQPGSALARIRRGQALRQQAQALCTQADAEFENAAEDLTPAGVV